MMKRLLTILCMPALLLLSSTEGWSLPLCEGSNADNWTNCFGTMTWADGDKYVGEFKNGKRNGQGTYIFADGDKYVGEFKDDKKHEQGQQRWRGPAIDRSYYFETESYTGAPVYSPDYNPDQTISVDDSPPPPAPPVVAKASEPSPASPEVPVIYAAIVKGAPTALKALVALTLFVILPIATYFIAKARGRGPLKWAFISLLLPVLGLILLLLMQNLKKDAQTAEKGGAGESQLIIPTKHEESVEEEMSSPDDVSGIVDMPVRSGDPDNLDIIRYALSLIQFIEKTNTPLTIGIQGEWGSGKTSLLNFIHDSLENSGKSKQIWINSWESSLLSTPEETLIKIINEIINELLKTDVDVKRKDAIKNTAAALFKGALRVGATAALGAKGGDVAEELFGEADNSIRALRVQLDELSKEIRTRATNPYDKIIIYVDDLDRIEPKDAVSILELLKNVFSIKGCVFVLAIDYQVVIKGLKDKFGERTPENEWEFRAFFDKIIQLPFMMPMGQYNIGNYVNYLLKQIKFVGDDGLDSDAVEEIVVRTIGGNPRSLKRLVNSLALIEIFTATEGNESVENGAQEEDVSAADSIDEDKKRLLLLSLVCLQNAYPDIYALLSEKPDFVGWDDDVAFEQTRLKEEDEKEEFEKQFELAQKTEDFDEIWEKVLFRICYPTPRYRARVADISKFFSYIKDNLLAEKGGDIGNIIAKVINQTTVTSISTTDGSKSNVKFKDAKWKSSDDKIRANKLWNLILDEIEGTTKIYKKGRRSGSSGVIRLTDKSVHPDVMFEMGHGGGGGGPRLMFQIKCETAEESTSLLQKLQQRSDEIEATIGSPLEWKSGSRRALVILHHPDPGCWKEGTLTPPDESKWDEIVKFFSQYAPLFESAMCEAFGKIRDENNQSTTPRPNA